jgi:hypothetical protein
MAAIQKGGGSLDGWMACVPDGVTGSQVNDVAMKYLAEHPQQRHFSAPSLIAKALSEAFPCPP